MVTGLFPLWLFSAVGDIAHELAMAHLWPGGGGAFGTDH
jgi:hypothetical protein